MQFQFEDFLSGVDSVMIIDENYIILHAIRTNSRVNSKPAHHNHDKYVNKSIFDIFPSIPIKESSYSEARQTKKPVVRYNQNYTDCFGMVCKTNNITIPLLRQGKVCGYVGLSKDITTVNSVIKGQIQVPEVIKGTVDLPPMEKTTFEHIITQDETMMKAIALAKNLASSNGPILIYGETGTGKELFAQAIMNYSNIPRSKIITQNCAAIPENLIEAMLFGTTKGSFTGAENKDGLMKLADDGILFLDELNSLPYHVQGSLLRVLQEGTYRPVGSHHELKSSARIIAAMNMNPRDAITRKQLREDLFYRFSSGIVSIPPLRNRPGDINLYLDYYLNAYRKRSGRFISGYASNLISLLHSYPWPGNVRELRHLIEFMVSNTDSRILSVSDLPAYMVEAVENAAHEAVSSQVKQSVGHPPVPDMKADVADLQQMGLSDYMLHIEKKLIAKALYDHRGSISHTAEYLKLPRQTLTYKMQKYGLNRKSFIHPKI
ncbi:MAG: sigma 54-interacting transcriptional regulator [Firmicutes bacterium]|nr:sigma 54-interacting transcriptional regulator [Bacillota bacterium]